MIVRPHPLVVWVLLSAGACQETVPSQGSPVELEPVRAAEDAPVDADADSEHWIDHYPGAPATPGGVAAAPQLRVHRDRVGVILDEGVAPTALRKLLHPEAGYAPPANVSDLEQLTDRLHVVDPVGAPDRDGLCDYVRGLARDHPGVVEHAGLLVTPENAEQPLLMTHELIVQLSAKASEEAIAALLAAHGVAEVERGLHDEHLRLLATSEVSDADALETCDRLATEPLVEFCEPNFVHDVEYLSPGLDDPLLHLQWHHENTGRGGGAVDADIDTPQAWELTTGAEDVVIAVLEDGFDAGHPDLVENLWSDPADPSMHGWDFEDDDATLAGDPGDRGATSHGTAVAGCAGARGDNGIGVAGSAPDCSLMLLRRPGPTDFFSDAQAIHFAWKNGADVITNSWTYAKFHPIPHSVRRAIETAATQGRNGKGCVVVFAVRNEDVDIDQLGDVAALEQVLAVGAVTNTDERTRSCGKGESLDVLGPTRLSQAPNFTEGTLDVATTDWRGRADGYNRDPAMEVERDAGWPPCGELDDEDYTLCFGGTSAAAPIVAGVAGLVLSVAPELTAEEVRHLLRDTTDRVQDSAAAYSTTQGHSTNLTHGHGRVNAFEAVRVVAPPQRGGLGGVDVFLRDHRLDWGNTEQPSWLLFEPERGRIGPWQSPDVVVDAPPFAEPPRTSAAFDALTSEPALPGATNRVFVRVRNRGPRPATDVTVRLYAAEAGTCPPDTLQEIGVRVLRARANINPHKSG